MNFKLIRMQAVSRLHDAGKNYAFAIVFKHSQEDVLQATTVFVQSTSKMECMILLWENS